MGYNFIQDASDTWTVSTIPFINYNFETSNQYFRPIVLEPGTRVSHRAAALAPTACSVVFPAPAGMSRN